MYSLEESETIMKGFSRLKDVCYLDTVGAALYCETQMKNVMHDLCTNIYGNPHSLSETSKCTTDAIDQVRYSILHYFHTSAEEYSVIFTSGATAALKLVAESFNWAGGREMGYGMLNKPNENGNIDYTNGSFVYLQDNHTSVLGMREFAYEKGAKVKCISHSEAFNIFNKDYFKFPDLYDPNLTNSLFVYPAQCNFSGVKYPLSWVEKTHKGVLDTFLLSKEKSNWFCFLDAASYVATNTLNLSETKPDFVCVSFYKIFGYPTGIGALLVKNSSVHVLRRNYFGGGTVEIALSSDRFHIPRKEISDRFEDGTLPFLSIIAIPHGFNALKDLPGGMKNLSLHTFTLSQSLFQSLLTLHHGNGKAVVVLYCDTDYQSYKTQSGVVNFNLLRQNGEYIGFVQVLNMANLYGIQFRTGCFCNPGACQRHLKLSEKDLLHQFQAGHVCGDERDLVDGKPTGSIRVSFGYMSSQQDVDKLLDMILKCFVEGPPLYKIPDWWPEHVEMYKKKFLLVDSEHVIIENKNNGSDINIVNNLNCDTVDKTGGNSFKNSVPHKSVFVNGHSSINNTDSIFTDCNTLSHIFLYPIKSCGAFPVKSWSIGSRGLLYDREWMIVTAAGTALTQKQDTKLCLIKPVINLKTMCLDIQYPGMDSISVSLLADGNSVFADSEASLCHSKVCGDRIFGWDCGDTVAQWLSAALCRDGVRLIRQQSSDHRMKTVDKETRRKSQLSLTNQAQYLILNLSSIMWLKSKLDPETDWKEDGLLERFRSNLVVNGEHEFEENEWRKIKIGDVTFQFDSPCTRCQMICIDQSTGEKTVEPLRTLAENFHGKMRFGVYFSNISENSNETKKICVGDKVVILSKHNEH